MTSKHQSRAISFEEEIRSFLSSRHNAFADRSSSFTALDFTLLKDGRPIFSFDAKEKRQRYNLRNWPAHLPEEDLFILDDLAVRKVLAFAPDSGICVRDSVRRAYYFYSAIDLALMPRLRVNRPIARKVKDFKGKWLIDLKNAGRADSLESMFDLIRNYYSNRKRILFEIHECYGEYRGEELVTGGVVRRPGHWTKDVSETR